MAIRYEDIKIGLTLTGTLEPPAGARTPAPRADAPKCQYLGEAMRTESGGPALEVVPCKTCGSKGGRSPKTVFECSAPDNPAGECLPTYRPTDEQLAEYLLREEPPRVCHRCPHFTPPA